MRTALPKQTGLIKDWADRGRSKSVSKTDIFILIAVTITGIVPGLLIAESTLAVTNTGSSGVCYHTDETENGEHALNNLDGAALADGRNDVQQFEQAIDEGDEKGGESS